MLCCSAMYCVYMYVHVCVYVIQVDDELFSALSAKSWGEATKFALVCSNEDLFKIAVENLVQVCIILWR